MGKLSVGIVGARGHVGAELLRLIAGHPGLELSFVVSRELAGQALLEGGNGAAQLVYENLGVEQIAARRSDVVCWHCRTTKRLRM